MDEDDKADALLTSEDPNTAAMFIKQNVDAGRDRQLKKRMEMWKAKN